MISTLHTDHNVYFPHVCMCTIYNTRFMFSFVSYAFLPPTAQALQSCSFFKTHGRPVPASGDVLNYI